MTRTNSLQNKNIFYFFILESIIIVAYVLSGKFAALLAVSISVVYMVFNYEQGVFFWCSCCNFVYLMGSTYYAIYVGCFILITLLRHFELFRYRQIKTLTLIIYIFSVGALSYYYGIDSQIISLLMTYGNIMVYALLLNVFRYDSVLNGMMDSVWASSFLFIGITTISLVKSGFHFTGRLGFEDNVRSLANAVAIPIYIWLVSMLSRHNYGYTPRKLQHFIGIVGSVLLLLTVTKGAIFALIIAMLVYCIITKKGWIKILVLALLAIIAGIWMQSNGIVDFTRFTQRNYDLNGRTSIWQFYYMKLKERGTLGYLFGFGPGNVQRLFPEEYYGRYYVHSTILDFFFSYGIFAFLGIITLFGVMISKSIKAKEYMGLGLIILLFLSYSITGSSTNTQILLNLTIANFAIAEKTRGETIISNRFRS